MTTSKIVAALAVVMAASFSTLTLNAKGETKDSNSPTEAKANDETTTYYVNGETPDHMSYTISTTQTKACTGSPVVPCEFTSPDSSLGSTIPKADVDNENDDIVITGRRPSL